jgi:hypothetical protein
VTEVIQRGAPRVVILNYLGASVAGLLTAFGLFLREFGGLLVLVPAGLLVMAAGPLTVAFVLAALWWKRGLPLARVIQLLPLLIILAWAALILLSPVQTRPPTP